MKTAITFILMLCCGLLQAQKISVGIEGYIGAFDMSLLKQYQATFKGGNIPFKTVQNFPMRPGIRIVGVLPLDDNLSTGILLGMVSTGGRLAYSDLTGNAYRDVIVNGLQFGSYSRYTFFNHNKLSLAARVNFGGVFNNVKFDEHIHLTQPGYESHDVSEWRSVNFYSDLGIEGRFAYDRFLFKVFTSYEFGIPSGMKRKAGDGSDSGAPPFDVNWNGFRAGIGIEYKFSRQE